MNQLPAGTIETCPNCGEELRSGMMRCRECGHTRHQENPPSRIASKSNGYGDVLDSAPPATEATANESETVVDNREVTSSGQKKVAVTPPGSDDTTDSRLAISCECGRKLRIKQELRGKRVKCPTCGTRLVVPGGSERKKPQSTGSGRDQTTLSLSDAILTAATSPEPVPVPGKGSPTPKRKPLGFLKFRTLKRTLDSKKSTDKDDAIGRAEAALELGASGDPRASALLLALLEDEWLSVREAATVALGKLEDRQAALPLMNQLASEQPELRKAATISLGQIGDARAVIPLLVLGMEDPRLRFLASESVVKMGDAAVSKLLEVINSGDKGLQLEATVVLGKIGAMDAVTSLEKLANQGGDLLRTHVAESLGRIGGTEATRCLVRLCQDPATGVRLNAVTGLGRIGDQRTSSAIRRLLQDEDEDVLEATVTALESVPDPAAVDSLLSFLQSEKAGLRVKAVKALAALGDARCATALIELLPSEGDPHVRGSLVEALGSVQDPRIVKPLLELLETGDDKLRQRVIESLGTLGDKRATQAVISQLGRGKTMEIRMAAARSLGQIGDSTAIEALYNAFQDEFPVRCRAVIALGEIDDPSALPPLLSALRDPASEVRYHATQAIGALGQKNASKYLEDRLGDTDAMVRRGAAKALCKLGDPRGERLLTDAAKPIRVRRSLTRALLDLIPDSLAFGIFPDRRTAFIVVGMVAAVLLAVPAWVALSAFMNPPDVFIVRSNIQTVAFSPDGTRLAVGRTKGMIETWNPQSSQFVSEGGIDTSAIKGIAYRPDGSSALVVGGFGARFVRDGSFLSETPVVTSCIALAATADLSTAVALGSDGTATFFDMETGEPRRALEFPKGFLRVLAISPDGDYLVGAGKETGVLSILDAENGAPKSELSAAVAISCVTISGDGKWIAAGLADGTVQVWGFDQTEPTTLAKANSAPTLVKFLGNEKLIACCETSLVVWNLDNPSEPPSTLPGIRIGDIRALAISSNNNLLAIGGPEATMAIVYDLKAKKVVRSLDR